MPTPPADNPAPRMMADAPSASLPDAARQALNALSQGHRLRQLSTAEPNGRYREVGGRRLLNLAGNDYLGLSQHPTLIAAAIEAAERFGVGSGASRLVSGTLPIHEAVEQRFAAFKHAEAALLLPTGYTANLAVLTTLAGKGDLIVMDKLVHASLIDAARASGAEVRTFPHLSLDRAEQLLGRASLGRRFLVTDSVFSMDGDCADLPGLCDLADRFDASLIVDEAHGTGVLGPDGSGLAAEQGVAERVYRSGSGGVVISTASKALGSLGGLITADRTVIELIVNKARPFIYSTALPPGQVAAIGAALDVIREEPQRREQLKRVSTELRRLLQANGWPPTSDATFSPILPLVVGDEQAALSLQANLSGAGISAPAIRPPTVAPGQCRVRLSLRSDLTPQDINDIAQSVGRPAQ